MSSNKKEPEPCPTPVSTALATIDTTPVAGHQFGSSLIAMFMNLVLKVATSQRAAAGVLELISPYIPGLLRVPCANAGRLWLMRLGLYELLRQKEQADDWVWIMDHTVQLGPHKCLVIAGVRLSVWMQKKAPLEHEDLSLLNLTPMEQSTAVAVKEQLEATRKAMGVEPVAVLSDEGAELKKGMTLFCEQLPKKRQVRHVLDIKHKVALLLKSELQEDATWQSFVTLTNRTKLQTTLTELAFLVPPSLRNKARFMNLDTLVDWGTRALAYLDAPRDFPEQMVDRKKLHQKLGWLAEYRSALASWAELLALANSAIGYVRKNGYHCHAVKELNSDLLPLAHTPGGHRLQARILEFVKQQSRGIKKGQHVLGSSEVLESLLGKYKRIQGTHSKGGMTGSLLNIGAAVAAKTSETIQIAFAAVSVAAVGKWIRENLGLTVPAQQALAFQENKNCLQNKHVVIPGF